MGIGDDRTVLMKVVIFTLVVAELLLIIFAWNSSSNPIKKEEGIKSLNVPTVFPTSEVVNYVHCNFTGTRLQFKRLRLTLIRGHTTIQPSVLPSANPSKFIPSLFTSNPSKYALTTSPSGSPTEISTIGLSSTYPSNSPFVIASSGVPTVPTASPSTRKFTCAPSSGLPIKITTASPTSQTPKSSTPSFIQSVKPTTCVPTLSKPKLLGLLNMALKGKDDDSVHVFNVKPVSTAPTYHPPKASPSLSPSVSPSSSPTLVSTSRLSQYPSSTRPSSYPSIISSSPIQSSSFAPVSSFKSPPKSLSPSTSPSSNSPSPLTATASPSSSNSPSIIYYHPYGDVLNGTVYLYNIYYGNFNRPKDKLGPQTRKLVNYFSAHVGNSSWYKTVSNSYYQINRDGTTTFASHNLTFVKDINFQNVPSSSDIILNDSFVIQEIVNAFNTYKLPIRTNAIYAFIFRGDYSFSSDTLSSAWLTDWCG